MRFRAKDSAIRESIAPLRANHNARITSDFQMDLLNYELCCLLCLNASVYIRLRQMPKYNSYDNSFIAQNL